MWYFRVDIDQENVAEDIGSLKVNLRLPQYRNRVLTRMFHESLAATTDMAALPGVLGCWRLRRTVPVRLGTKTLRVPGGTAIFAVSRHQFMKHPV